MKNKNVSFLFVVVAMFLGSLSFAAEAGKFSHGNTLKMLNLSGSILVQSPCEQRSRTGHSLIKCENHELEQGNEDFFIGPVNADATVVELISKSESGEIHTKKATYNGAYGVTTGKVNLWYSTLFQSPLLEMGTNQIKFVLKNQNGDVLETGAFVATVEDAKALECDKKVVTSLTPFECRMTQQTCQKYFNQQNYCAK